MEAKWLHEEHEEEQLRQLGVDTDREKIHRLRITDVVMSKNAMITVGQAMRQVSASTEIPYELLKKRIFCQIYWLEPCNSLLLIISVPEKEMEMLIEIPEQYWWLKEKTTSCH